jgi:hypothetical protein
LLEPLLSNRLEGKGQRLNRLCVPPRDAEVLRRQDQGPQVKQVTFIKEKTMAPESGFKHASVPATLLRGAALAIALIVLASPARAETVTLVCQQEASPGNTVSGGSFTLRVDYDRKTVDLLRSDGTAYFTAAATITAGDVKWGDWNKVLKGHLIFRGELNRLSGQGWAEFPVEYGTTTKREVMSGPCRRATQKF